MVSTKPSRTHIHVVQHHYPGIRVNYRYSLLATLYIHTCQHKGDVHVLRHQKAQSSLPSHILLLSSLSRAKPKPLTHPYDYVIYARLHTTVPGYPSESSPTRISISSLKNWVRLIPLKNQMLSLISRNICSLNFINEKLQSILAKIFTLTGARSC